MRALLITIVVAVAALSAPVLAQVAVKGKIVHTMAGPAIVNGIVIVTGGKIAAIGKQGEVAIPEGYEVLVVCVRSSCELFEVHSFSRKARERRRSRSYFKLLQRRERSNGSEQFARTSDARH